MAAVQSLVRARPAALVGFSRPHTVIGTTVSITALYVLAWALPLGVHPPVTALLIALVAGLAVNIFIVGINQVADVELDRVNKPWLPLPARELSVTSARRIVGGSAVLAVVVSAVGSLWLLTAILIGLVLGTTYSLPPVHAKRHHVLAAASIVTVRGPVVNLLVFAHFAGAAIPAAIILLTVAVTALALVIAWFKDLPDMEGDRQFTVGTLPLRIGGARVVSLGVGALVATYTGVAVSGALGIAGLHGGVLVGGHLALAAFIVLAALRLDLADPVSVAAFYRAIWGMFYAEYVVFALAAVI
jgi:homogentisate phytyltransferase / homogentisate geranylgeranyltransferase